jgi:hypothetical protein
VVHGHGAHRSALSRHRASPHRGEYGASPTTAMTHIAIQESLDGTAVVWLEQVADADYHEPQSTLRS